MQSTINQLKHGKGRAVRDNGTHGVVSIDHQHSATRRAVWLSRPHPSYPFILCVRSTALPSVLHEIRIYMYAAACGIRLYCNEILFVSCEDALEVRCRVTGGL